MHKISQVAAIAGLVGGMATVAAARPDFSYVGAPVPIPDSGPGDCLSSPPGPPGEASINVPNNFTISSVSCSFWVTHTWQADVQLYLVHPDGTAVALLDRPGNPIAACGFANDNFGLDANTRFRAIDSAVQGPYDNPPLPAGQDSPTGDWKPSQPLAALVGKPSQGTWKLRGIDNASADIGFIQAVTITLEGATCYPDCNNDGTLTVQDFGCFQTQFVQGTAYADCNGDGVRTVQDFGCFQTKFVQGCP